MIITITPSTLPLVVYTFEWQYMRNHERNVRRVREVSNFLNFEISTLQSHVI